MTKEKNINVTAEQDKFADEVLTENELDNVAGGTTGKKVELDVFFFHGHRGEFNNYDTGGK